MKAAGKTVTLLTILIASYFAGILIFTKGFLLARTMVHKNSTCEVEFATRGDDIVSGVHSGCWTHARFKKAIVIIIDALRYDFLAHDNYVKATVGLPPYKNRFTTVDSLLKRNPKKALLYKFMADPPTTTLQRLKGLTTGSLPTFVDAGANFDSSEINEDNWIDQLIAQGKEIKFFGDDTWEKLFPKRFTTSYPFPSFNVKDLHTVDNGILKKLYSELRKKDWDVVIAHFLGVDHCGHRYGPNHPAMSEKLDQMNEVIRNITQLMKEDSVLFVFGDHGMTRMGDHGGDSEDEISAGLFIYSPAQLTASTPSQDIPAVVQQVDLVPTISLLLGLPIPFSNLGTVIPDLFNHCPWWETQHNNIRQVFHAVKALHLNAQQVARYISAYSKISSDLPRDKLVVLQAALQRAEAELQFLVTGVATGTPSQALLERFFNLQDLYLDYLAQVRSMCQEVWAKFDLISIGLGILILLGSVIINLMIMICWPGDGDELPASFSFIFGAVILQIVYHLLHMVLFTSTVPPIMSYCIGLLLVFSVAIMLKNKLKDTCQNLCLHNFADWSIATLVMLMYICTFFSNSFVVYEDSVTHFLAQTVLWYTGLRLIMKKKDSAYLGSKDVSKLVKKPRHSFVDFFEWLTQPAFVTFLIVFVCSLFLRLSTYFRACREEQWECELSSFLKPLSAFSEYESSLKNQRYFFSSVLLFTTLWLLNRWLQYYGNLNGYALNVVCTKIVPYVAGTGCVLYWAVQALPQKELDALPAWQQTVTAQMAYACIAVLILTNLFEPIYVFIHKAETATVTVPLNNSGPEYTVPFVYRQLKQHWNKKEEASAGLPQAYGLGTVYSSGLLCICLPIFVLLVLLLGDGVAPGLILAVYVYFFFMELTSAHYRSSTRNYDAGIAEEPVSWLTVVTHGLLSSVFFFATGHQATIPSIRFESAFTGFHGDFSNNVVPALLISFNTFAAPIIFTALFPLAIFWPHLITPVSQWMTANETQKKRWRGDFALFDNGMLLKKNLLMSCCRLLLFHALKVLSAACAASLHRRHLMVWKIFAPHFVFEAASFLAVCVILWLVMLYVLHIDQALNKLTRSLK